MRYGLWNDPAECLHIDVSFLFSFLEYNCISILQASCFIRTVFLFKIIALTGYRTVLRMHFHPTWLMHTPLQLCDVSRAGYGLHFTGTEKLSSSQVLASPKPMAWARSVVTVAVDSSPLLFVMGLELSLVSRCWELATEFTHIIMSVAPGGIQDTMDSWLLCLVFTFNSQQSSFISQCVWKKRVIPPVPKDRNQGQE